MRIFLFAYSVLTFLPFAFASQIPQTKDSFIGTYVTVTESECNIELQIDAAGKGVWTQACALEKSPGKAESKKDIKWILKENSIELSYQKETASFTLVKRDISEYGCEGMHLALVPKRTINKNSIFGGYGSSLWKAPLPKCKK